MTAPDQHEIAGTPRTRTSTALRWALSVATVAMIVWLAIRSWDDLRQIQLNVDAVVLVPAVLISMTATVCLALAWRELVGGYSNSVARNSVPKASVGTTSVAGTSLARGPALRIWLLSQTTRYLPTGLVPVAARAAMAAPFGVPHAAGVASVVVETATLLGWAALAAALWAPSDWLGSAGGWFARILIGVGAGVGLVTLPWTLAGAGAWWRRIESLLRRTPSGRWLCDRIRPDTLSAARPAVWRATFVYGCAVAQRLIASALLAASLLAVGFEDARLIAGAVAAGIVVGMVGITPAGLGVRELVVAALLADRLGVGDATAFAIALRVLEFAHELVLLPVVVLADRWRRSANIHVPPRGE